MTGRQHQESDARRAPDRMMTSAEVAEILQVSVRTVHRLARAGRLERVRISHKTARYTRDSVEAFIHPHAGELTTCPNCGSAVYAEWDEDGTPTYTTIYSPRSGRLYGIAINQWGGEEHIDVTELEPPKRAAEKIAAEIDTSPVASEENPPC